MTTLNFTDRTSYLAWRAEWKANYKQISIDIRRLKRERSSTNSTWSKDETAENWGKYCLAMTALYRMKRDANEALETLKLAKLKAAKQWQDEHTIMCDCGKPWNEPHSCNATNHHYWQNHHEDHGTDSPEPVVI